MKKIALISFLMISALGSLFAQTEIKLQSVNCYNLGDGRYYCQDKKTKEPLQGSSRLIDGYTTQYVEATFKDGIPDGSWKLYKYNKLAEEYTYNNGVLNGFYKEYYSDGSTKSSMNYVNGKPEGKFIKYGANGKKESEINYKNGVQDGAEIFYDSEGNVRSETKYTAGKETGKKTQKISGNAGDYELTANYNDGKYDGDYSEIFTNGNIKVKGQYKTGKKEGTWEYGKKDGQKIRTDVYSNDDKIKETIYYTDGTVEVVRELKNGKKNGWERKYTYGDGSLKSELYYKDGEVSSTPAAGGATSGNNTGLTKQTKQITSNIGNYIQSFYQVNGKYEGEYTEQWVDGDKGMKVKGQYKAGKKTGLWTYANKYGRKEKEETYADDKLNGKQIYFESNGETDKFYTYKNDVKDGEYANYSNGKVSEEGTYVNGRVEGKRTYYFPNGKPSTEEVIPHDPDGLRTKKEYYQSGILREESSSENGSRVEMKTYHENGKLYQVYRQTENGGFNVVEEYDEQGKKVSKK